MQPVRSVKNQYVGINAHLHSFWQARGWSRFHNYYIGQLMALLKAQLIPMGYTAEIEESLQIRRVGDISRPRADIFIGDLDSQRMSQRTNPTSMSGHLLALEALIDEDEDREHPYAAVALYEFAPELGEPVGWLELLSPSNKGGSADARAYRHKRAELLHTGLIFLEIDYLHESAPTFWRLPDYSQREANAHPYRIVVLDPRPEFRQGCAHLYDFDVEEAIPTVEIPLNGSDKLAFDFDRAYQKTFQEGLYGYSMDYRELPQNFERYSADDQARIARRMVAVLEAVKNGVDLESGPFPPPGLGLEAALERIKML
jgi:Protein of unknown function (DUF4058)